VIKTINKDSYNDVTPGVFMGWDVDGYKVGFGDGTSYMRWAPTTGLSVKTGDTAVKGIEINPNNDNQMHFYGNRGDGVVEDLAIIGITAFEGGNVVGYFGSEATGTSVTGVVGVSDTRYGVRGKARTKAGVYGLSDESNGVWGVGWGINQSGIRGDSYNFYGRGVTGQCNNGWGVYGESTSGTGVKGHSSIGIGVHGTSGTKCGGEFSGATAGTDAGSVVLVPATSFSAPTHVAPKGTMWTRSDGYIYFNYTSSNNWRLISAITVS